MTEQYLANLKTYQVNLPELVSKMQPKIEIKTEEDKPIHPSFFDLDAKTDVVIPEDTTNTFLSTLKDKMIANEKNIVCPNVFSLPLNQQELQTLKHDLLIAKKNLGQILQTNIHRKRIQDLLFQKDNLQGLSILIKKNEASIYTRICKKFVTAYNNGQIVDIIKEYDVTTNELESQLVPFDEKIETLNKKQQLIDSELEKLILSPLFDDFLTKVNKLFRFEIESFSFLK